MIGCQSCRSLLTFRSAKTSPKTDPPLTLLSMIKCKLMQPLIQRRTLALSFFRDVDQAAPGTLPVTRTNLRAQQVRLDLNRGKRLVELVKPRRKGVEVFHGHASAGTRRSADYSPERAESLRFLASMNARPPAESHSSVRARGKVGRVRSPRERFSVCPCGH